MNKETARKEYLIHLENGFAMDGYGFSETITAKSAAEQAFDAGWEAAIKSVSDSHED